ncbi:MAG: hypothetical protein WCG21_13345 [Eubacteriales bacterium]
MPRIIHTDYCSISEDQRTITIQVMDLPFASDPSSKTLKLDFECNKYLYGYCPSAKVCPLFEKA